MAGSKGFGSFEKDESPTFSSCLDLIYDETADPVNIDINASGPTESCL